MDQVVEVSVLVFICVRIFSYHNNIIITHSWMSFRRPTEEEQLSMCFDGTRQSWFRLFTSRTLFDNGKGDRLQLKVKTLNQHNHGNHEEIYIGSIISANDGLFIPIWHCLDSQSEIISFVDKQKNILSR